VHLINLSSLYAKLSAHFADIN